MNELNSIKKKIAKKNLKVSFIDPSKLLAESFNSVFIKIDKECIYES